MGFSNPTGGEVTVSSNVNANITNPDTSPVPVTVISEPNSGYVANASVHGGSASTNLVSSGGQKLWLETLAVSVSPDGTNDNSLTVNLNGNAIYEVSWLKTSQPFSLSIPLRILAGTFQTLAIARGVQVNDCFVSATYSLN